MDRFRIKFDQAARHWVVRRDGGGRVLARRLILEVDAAMKPGGHFVCEGILRAGDLVSVSDSDAVVGELRVERVTELPHGRVNVDAMDEWCVAFDESSGLWTAFMREAETAGGVHVAIVTAESLELGCHAVSSDGLLHCMAEVLVDGRTFRSGTSSLAKSVRLRTLIVHDQTLELPVMAMRGKSKMQKG